MKEVENMTEFKSKMKVIYEHFMQSLKEIKT